MAPDTAPGVPPGARVPSPRRSTGAGSDGAIPVALCFDVEPDEFEVSMRPQPWKGFERLVGGIETIRAALAEASGRPVRFNWFLRMDPQVADSHGHAGWVADRYGDRLAALRAAGDGVGLHPHAWRWSAARDRWIADHADPDWMDHCVRLSFETFERTMGEPCRSIRFGDRFLTSRALRLAAAMGARYDLTVEPGMAGARRLHRHLLATGRIPSHVLAPRSPYRPSPDDPLQPGGSRAPGHPTARDADAGPWMIPLTAIDTGLLEPGWRRAARRLRYPFRPRHRTAVLGAAWDADRFWEIIGRDLDAASRPYLAFAIRSDFALTPALDRAVRAKLAALRASPLVRRLEFTTPDAIVPGARG